MHCATCTIKKSNPKQKIIAAALLLVYLLSTTFHFFHHGKKHVHEKNIKHSIELEKNACHQSTAHFISKGNICHHQKHFKAHEKKCKDCEFYSTIDVEENLIFNFCKQFYFSISTFSAQQFHFLFYNKEYMGRAPPVFIG